MEIMAASERLNVPTLATPFQFNATKAFLKSPFHLTLNKFNSSINIMPKNFFNINTDFSIHLDNINSTRNINKNDTISIFYMEHAPQLTISTIIKIYVLIIMAIVSLIGNVLTLWNIYKARLAYFNYRSTGNVIYALIFHLTIADLLVTFFCIVGEAAWYYTVQWMANDFCCRSLKLLQMFSLYLSTYVLVLIGVYRWISIKYPMKSLYMDKRYYRLLIVIYLLALALSLPQFFIFHVARGPFIEEFYQCVTHGFYTFKWQEQIYTTSTLIFIFILPLIIIIFTYISTYSTIQASEKMFPSTKWNLCRNNIDGCNQTLQRNQRTNRQRLLHKAKLKSLRMSIIIIMAFIICWTPYNIMMMIFMFCNPNKIMSEHLQSAIFFFGMSNSLVNPLIYGAFHLYTKNKKNILRKRRSTYNYETHHFNGKDYRRIKSAILTVSTELDCCNDCQLRNSKRLITPRSVSMSDHAVTNVMQVPETALNGTA